MHKRLKILIVSGSAILVTGIFLWAVKLRIENRSDYWQWRIENNVDLITVIIFTIFILWLIIREILNKPDN